MKILRYSLFLLLLLPTMAMAQLSERMKNDFAPIEGIILMATGDTYLVDLDASENLHQGDILALVSPGKKIIHPVTQDVIGTLDDVTGYLQVTRVMSGYSHVSVLTEGVTIRPGDQVRRFDQVPAVLDASIPETVARQLRQELGHMNWQELTPDTSGPYLVFAWQDDLLSVSSATGELLDSYRYAAAQQSSAAAPAARAPAPPQIGTDEPQRSALNRGVDKVLGTVGLDRDKKRLEAPGIARTQETDGVWTSPPLNDNPVGIAVADLNGDGQPEIAIALTNELRIMRLDEGQFTLIAPVVTFPAGTQLLSIDALDLNNDGLPELYLTAANGMDLRSQVVEYRNGGFERVIGRINWFLRVIDLPGEGRVLLGQRMNKSNNPFRPPVFRVERNGDELSRGADLELPDQVNLFSLLPLSGPAGETRYATISTGDYLQVLDQEGERLWQSTDHFGGSDASFYNQPQTEVVIPDPVTVQKRLLQLPTGEILTIQNEGSRVLTRFRTFSSGQIVALDWDGNSLRERWKTPGQNGYMADFSVADISGDGVPELITAVRFQEKNLLQKGNSVLVIYPLR